MDFCRLVVNFFMTFSMFTGWNINFYVKLSHLIKCVLFLTKKLKKRCQIPIKLHGKTSIQRQTTDRTDAADLVEALTNYPQVLKEKDKRPDVVLVSLESNRCHHSD